MLRTLPVSLYLVLLLILVAANISLYRTLFASRALEVRALDVGKGDATLVRMQNGATILIDIGPDASILRALGSALPPWQRKIDIVILTGTKKSVVGGLPDVLNRYTVSQQITLTESQRLSLDANTFIDIVLLKDTPSNIYLSHTGTTTKIR